MMDISMVGIDHQNASIQEREAFAFTKKQVKKAMATWKEDDPFSGCLLLSTCNRTELWISGGENIDPFTLLCEAKGKEPEPYAALAVHRQGQEAVTHLLQLICGLKSKIYGEDQILSQVREALELSRTCSCCDTVVEKLFQTAISAGKKVKTQVKIQTADPSAARNVLMLLKEKMGNLKGLPCLIIGNGQMGKLVANTLVETGAHVTMTLRKKMHGKTVQDSIIPQGCHMIDYDERLKDLEHYKAVISATLSPHFTITKDQLKGKTFDSIWIDMAVPRDIDPACGDVSGIELFDMDSLGDCHIEARTEEALRKSMEILETYREELERWFAFRQHIDKVKSISQITADDACKRVETPRDSNIFYPAAEKAVEKLLFGLRETLPSEEWQRCLDALEKSAQRDTVKTGNAK